MRKNDLKLIIVIFILISVAFGFGVSLGVDIADNKCRESVRQLIP